MTPSRGSSPAFGATALMIAGVGKLVAAAGGLLVALLGLSPESEGLLQIMLCASVPIAAFGVFDTVVGLMINRGNGTARNLGMLSTVVSMLGWCSVVLVGFFSNNLRDQALLGLGPIPLILLNGVIFWSLAFHQSTPAPTPLR